MNVLLLSVGQREVWTAFLRKAAIDLLLSMNSFCNGAHCLMRVITSGCVAECRAASSGVNEWHKNVASISLLMKNLLCNPKNSRKTKI